MANEVAQSSDDTNRTLFKRSTKAFQSSVESVFTAQKDWRIRNDLTANAAQFAIYKSFYFTQRIKDNPKEAAQLIATMRQQLEVENDQVAKASRSAKRWLQFEATKDEYPNLEYLSSRSADQREEHKEYYGTILPIDHPFWDSNLPPNGWGCKCRVRRSRQTSTAAPAQLTATKGLPGNPGKTREVFSADHPLVRQVSEYGRQRLKDEYEQLKAEVPYSSSPDYRSGGSTVKVHAFSDKVDLEANFEAAQRLANQTKGNTILLRPHSNLKGKKNPEFTINGKLADLKHQQGTRVSSNINSALKQSCEVIVFRLSTESKLTTKRLIEKVRGDLKARSEKSRNQLKKIFIIDKNNQVSEFTP